MGIPNARRACSRAAACLLLLLAARAMAAGGPDADSLLRRAHARLASPDLDQRREGLADLESAARVAPDRPELWLELGRARHRLDRARESRDALARAAELAPEDARVQLELGRLWKWDWISSFDADSYRRAVAALERAASLGSRDEDVWLELTALALARGDPAAAAAAAGRAWRADPRGALPAVAEACAAYRVGILSLADSLFEVARERLPADLRRRFEDVTWFAGAAPGDSGDPSRFWSRHDPDLTTIENEARLSFESRVGHAMLLFRDGASVPWDARTEMAVRYGLPAWIQDNPPGGSHNLKGLTYVADDTFGYPFHDQVWSYPALGMQVWLQDRSLEGRYSLPVTTGVDPDPRPDPRVIASRPDLAALADGRAVFRSLAPGLHARQVRARVLHYPGERGGRLVGILTTPGEPADTLTGTWVVRDEAGREVVRASRSLAASACDPTGLRAADFAADLPAGKYALGFAVQDARMGRGVATADAEVAALPAGLALSDLTPVCGDPGTAIAGPGVRVEPSLDARVVDRRSIAVYFEIAHLALDARGEARFTYAYRVIPEAHPGAGTAPEAPVVETTHEETNVGGRRRQFVTVPLEQLADGAYRLEVEVRDAIGAATAVGELRFAKVTTRPPGDR
jgi:tetratricopeptide (TPR) repeat protein